MKRTFKDLRPYQREAIRFALETPKCNIWAECGLGKSIIALTVIDTLEVLEPGHKVLVLGPLRVARDVWPKEPDGWDFLSHIEITPIIGTATQRRTAMQSRARVHTISYDNVPWLLEELGEAWPYTVVIADEASRLKGHDAKRFKGTPARKGEDGKKLPAKRGLQDVAHLCARWINLTGTPAPNGSQDLWSQTYLLDQGRRLGKNITAFRNRWFQKDYSGFGYRELPHAEKEIKALLQDITFTLRAADYLELPPLVETTTFVEMGAARETYAQMAKTFLADIGGFEVIAVNAAVKSGKLLQLASGAAYTDGEGAWHEVHTHKLEALDSIVEESGENVIVVYQFQSDLARLQARYPKAVQLKTSKDEANWNAGKIKMLLIHPDSAGHGVNLHHGGRTIVIFSHGWNLETYQQVIERAGPTRQLQAGYNRPVFLHHIVAHNTIEEAVLARLQTKASVQDAIKDYMRKLK